MIDNNEIKENITKKVSVLTERNSNDQNIIIGIDLGTTNSVISVWKNNKYEIITDKMGNKLIPSIISFYDDVKLYGNEAKSIQNIGKVKTIYDVKRLIGRSYSEIINDIDYLNYKIKNDDNNILIETINSNIASPEALTTMFLIYLKECAENYLNAKIDGAVITVPAYFNDSQRSTTLKAAQNAKLNVKRIINEPSSAALAYGLCNHKKDNVLIYDLGGGTLDVSIVSIDNGMIRVLASTGNTFLGGIDFNNKIINYVISQFKKIYNIKEKMELSTTVYKKLLQNVENVKKILSTNDFASIFIEHFYNKHNLSISITREKFEQLCNDVFVLCMKPIDDVLKSSNINREDINDIILVGGSSRIPKIKKNIETYFDNCNVQINNTINPDETVSVGASIYGRMIINKNDPFTKNLILLDIYPLSLGVETMNKIMTTIIPRNSTLPIKRKKNFTTEIYNQNEVNVNVYEGERTLTKDNYHICSLCLKKISHKNGLPVIAISFEIDINGILCITAVDRNNGNENKVVVDIKNNKKNNDMIEQIIKESEKNKEADKLNQDKVITIHNINNFCNSIISNIKRSVELNEDVRNEIINKLTKTKKKFSMDKFEDFEVDNLKRILKDLKKEYINYNTCIINKNNGNDDDVEGISDLSINSVAIYQNTNDNKNDIIENDVVENNNYDDTEINNIKQKLEELCDNIVNIIKETNINVSEEDKCFLLDYIDTVYIWLCLNDTLDAKIYINKIDEININCNKILEKYDDNKLFENNDNYKDELKTICHSLCNLFRTNHFNIDLNKIKELERMTSKSLDYIKLIEKNDPNNINDEINKRCKDMLEEINIYCNNIYSYSD